MSNNIDQNLPESKSLTWPPVLIPLAVALPVSFVVWITLAFSYDKPGSESQYANVIGFLMYLGLILVPLFFLMAIFSKFKGWRQQALLFSHSAWIYPIALLILRLIFSYVQ